MNLQEEMTNSTDTTSPIALLLRGDHQSPDDRRLADILDFFDIPWAALTISDAMGDGIASLTAGDSRSSILTSAPCLIETLQRGNFIGFPSWLTAASSVFVYGFQTTDACRNLLRKITGDSEASVRSLAARPTTASVADNFPEMCGPMSGVQMQLEPGAAESALTIQPAAGDLQSIVSAPEGHLFARFVYAGVPFFVDASQTIMDIRQRSATHFDVKKSFAGAVPIVMYLRWAFRETSLTTQERSACLIIDDPPLKPRYGFLEFRELLQLMSKQTFATTIAFIPWNWRRTNHGTVATFQQNSEKLSVCVHGCNHSDNEFATRSTEMLDRKLKVAKYQMHSLLERTGLDHDRVMVFPQGAFSPEAGLALKENGFAAAVNSEVAPADRDLNETTIADLWSVAILRYGAFPIFTRRYITHGIENFAFDGLLGKPCFITAHHEDFRDHGSKLSEFVGELNSLKWKLCWRTLGNAVYRSYSIQNREGILRVKMFAEQLFLENVEAVPRQVTVVKEEPSIAAIKDVTVNQVTVDYEYASGCLQFVVDLQPKRAVEISCTYHERTDSFMRSESISRKLQVAVRRYLNEFSDNHVSRSDFLRRAAIVAKLMLSRFTNRKF